jgi:5'-methylthioadenosine phosphorylase
MAELRIGVIGGTGIGEAMGAEGTRHEVETPFGRPSDAIVEAEWAGAKVLMLARHGPGHLIPPTNVNSRANLFALKRLGCTHILATGAVGSLREEYKPRQLVVPEQVIDRTTRRPSTFYEAAAVHVEFAEPFCPVLRQILSEASQPAEGESMVHHGGSYVCMEGPAFSTRAESLMHRLWGGDLIGMTAMPEAKLAREAEIPYALVALVTDYDSWRHKPSPTAPGASTAAAVVSAEKVDPHLLLKEITGNLKAASENAWKLIRRAIELMPSRREQLEHCPARNALELAIWSDKSRVPREEIERLAPLWGRHFEPR